jgi:hypothetical protein
MKLHLAHDEILPSSALSFANQNHWQTFTYYNFCLAVLHSFVQILFNIAMRTPLHLRNPNHKRGSLGQSAKPDRSPPTTRTVCNQDSVLVWAWPSRGGLIVLERATALDFDFLGLDSVHPPMRRDPDQDAEDKLCERLLLLGAKWFDSQERYQFVAGVAEDYDPDILALEAGKAQAPTTMERRWVSVGLPSRPKGGLWVAEYDTVMYGMQEKYNLLPTDAGKVSLARTMDEKCEILKSMGARFFASLEQYDGAACLRAWQEKTQGEFGPLVQTQYEE